MQSDNVNTASSVFIERLPTKVEAKWLPCVTGLQEIMELGGWKSYKMVSRYAHLAPEHLSNAAARIERERDVVSNEATISRR